MQRQRQCVHQEVAEAGFVKTGSANVPGRTLECDINKGWVLRARKVPQGHSHRCRRWRRRREQGHLASASPFPWPPQAPLHFLEIAVPPAPCTRPLFLLYKCKCRQQPCLLKGCVPNVHSCCFNSLPSIFVECQMCTRHPTAGPRRETDTLSASRSLCSRSDQKMVAAGEEVPGALDVKREEGRPKAPFSRIHPEHGGS